MNMIKKHLSIVLGEREVYFKQSLLAGVAGWGPGCMHSVVVEVVAGKIKTI